MGIYFNPENEGFRKAAESEIYIDKSGLLNITNKLLHEEKNCISVSHARRFGKSQAARMIDAYYSRGSNSKELFSSLEISKSPDFEKYLNKYNVIHFDISSFTDEYSENLVDEIKRHLINDLKESYPDINYSLSTAAILDQIYRSTVTEKNSEGIKFVIIIDEWDCVIRNFADNTKLVHEYLQFLHSLFKSNEAVSFLGLGYITGILPIKKIKDESALNNFTEYTMIESSALTPYFGFTEEEVKHLCNKYNMPFDSIKEWYNGYLIDGQHMYNPNSVSEAMMKKKIKTYWKNTSAFETINTFITLNFDGLKEDVIAMLSGEKIYVNVNSFENDFSKIANKDDALTALIHLGYLAYDEDECSAYIPNYEVADAYKSAIAKGKWHEIAETISRCEELLLLTIKQKSEKVAELIALSHETYSSVLNYNDENALSCAVTMAYFTAPAYYNVVREFPSGKGFADIVFIPRADSSKKPAMVIELKYDKSADTAIKQIKEKRYAGTLKGYGKEVLLVGISYDRKTKMHECVIESDFIQ